MFPSVYTGAYESSPEYRIPTGTDIFESLEHPNLSSTEYRRQPIERTVKMHPVWERVAMNCNKQILIATNKSAGREWGSSMWAFENVDKIEPKKATFRLHVASIVTNIAYMSERMIIGTFRNGGVQLWSSYSEEVNPRPPYSLYTISKQFEHFRSIECLDTSGETKAVTGSQECLLKVWDVGGADLRSVNTYRFAHLDAITGIAISKETDCIFATSSRDRSVLLWDTRNIRPAIALYEDHTVFFRDVVWDESKLENVNNFVYAGDEAGRVHFIDKRSPKTFLWSQHFFERPIRKIAIKGNNMAIISDLNKVKIYSIPCKKVIYENDVHQHFIRDCLWYDEKRLLTVGSDGQLLSHYVPAPE